MLNIRSGLKNKILNYFFINIDSPIYINELARQLDADPKNVYRNLLQLEQAGLLQSEFKGKERYFGLNKANPLTKNYRDLFLKTSGLEFTLARVLGCITGLKSAYIYGSYAKDRMEARSDIDLLLIGSHDTLAVQKAIYGIQKDCGREINAVNMSLEEFDKRQAGGDQFLTTVLKGKTIKVL